MIYFLKKEIEDYRLANKKFKYTRKDLMIKMLIDEVERQHKRINFLESKVRIQKMTIIKLEDAIMEKSHRLLLRCTSASIGGRDLVYGRSGFSSKMMMSR